MFQFNFGNVMELIEFDIEVKLGEQIVQQQHVQLPLIMAKPQCEQLVANIANDTRPSQITFKKKELMDNDVYMDAVITFSNNAYINAFPQEFKEEQ